MAPFAPAPLAAALALACTIPVLFPHTAAAQAASGSTVQLAPVVVRGDAATGSDTAGDTFTAVRSRSGSKTDSALIETPQTINVITRNEMDQRGVTSLVQAVRYTPGVVAQYGDNDVRYDWLTVRGFRPARYLDGLLLPFGARGYSQPRIDTYGLERVEVLKGPSSGLFGQTTPGGLVNMTSKRPTAERTNEVFASYGSFDQVQTGFDFSGPADDEGKFLYRLTGVGRTGDTQFQHVDDDRAFIAPSFTWQPSANTSINLSAQYQKIDSKGGGGGPVLPYAGTMIPTAAGYIPRDRFVGDPDYDRFKNETTMFGYTVDHRFNDIWSVKQTARYTHVDTDSRRVQIGQMATPTQAVRYAWAFPEDARTFQIDNQATARFDLGGSRHTVLVGTDYLHETSRFTESQLNILRNPAGTGFALFDVYRPVYGNLNIQVPPDGLRINQSRDQLGIYLQDQIDLGRLRLTLGARQDWADTDTNTWRAAGANDDNKIRDNRLTGRVGATYLYDNGLAPYVSYSTSFQPTAGTTRTGTALKPTTGEQIEAGIKYQPEGQASFVNLSGFEIVQNNMSAPDPVSTNFTVQTGRVRVRGLELEGKAQLSNAWSVIASYAFTDSEITKTNATDSAGQVGNQLAFVPRHQAALWTHYAVQSGPLAGLGAGVGATYRGSNYGDLNNRFAMKPVTLVDAALDYDLGRLSDSLRGASAAFNVSNLFDRRYVASCLSAIGCYWGSERTMMATLRYRW